MHKPFVFLLGLCLSFVIAGEPIQEMTVSENNSPQKQAVLAFIAKKKFLAEGNYPGATNELDRSRFESLVNALATRLIPIADKPEPKAKLFNEFKSAFPAFEYADTEERERGLDYFEELMGILGVESSDGVLNKLLYGFDPSQSVDAGNQEAIASMSEPEKVFERELASLNQQSALEFLTTTLGKPSFNQANTYIWLRDDSPDQSFSLTVDHGKSVLVWMRKGRFMYSRAL